MITVPHSSRLLKGGNAPFDLEAAQAQRLILRSWNLGPLAHTPQVQHVGREGAEHSNLGVEERESIVKAVDADTRRTGKPTR